MKNKVEIDIQITGVSDGDEARERVLWAIACRNEALLVLLPQIARIEHAVTVAAAARTSLHLRRRRKLDRRKSRLPKRQRACREKIEKPGGTGAVNWRRYGHAVSAPGEKTPPGNQRDTHLLLPESDNGPSYLRTSKAGNICHVLKSQTCSHQRRRSARSSFNGLAH